MTDEQMRSIAAKWRGNEKRDEEDETTAAAMLRRADETANRQDPAGKYPAPDEEVNDG